MNASSNVSNVEIANKIASTAALFRKYFPDASVNFSPWDNSNNESMQDTIDFAFHFPGWSPLIECRAILLQLRIENDDNGRVPKLLGIIMRGMIVPSERWRVATLHLSEGTIIPRIIIPNNFGTLPLSSFSILNCKSIALHSIRGLQPGK